MLITTQHAAEILGVSHHMVMVLIAQGMLKAQIDGGRVYVDTGRKLGRPGNRTRA
jgi:hypothetical protein